MKNKKQKILIFICVMLFIGIAGSLYSCNWHQGDSSQEVILLENEENDDNMIDNTQSVLKQDMKEQQEPSLIYVHICGAIKAPGVYEVEEGERLITIVTMAGGFVKEAAIDYVNLASIVKDGEKIYIPTLHEIKERNLLKDGLEESWNIIEEKTEKKVNLNTALLEELMTLSGIGESKALAIIQYREKHAFQSIEEVMNIEGIKQGVFQKIQDQITIN